MPCLCREVRCSRKAVGAFAEATSDVQRAATLINQLVVAGKADEYYDDEEIRTALLICIDRDEEVGDILQALDEDYELSAAATVIGKHLGDERLRRIVRGCVLSANKKTLSRLASFIRVFAAHGLELPKPPSLDAPADWIREYAAELHPVLSELNALTTDAPAIAARLLSKDFPNREGILNQIDVLEKKLSGPEDRPDEVKLRQGLENLRRKLDGPAKVSAQRLANLRGKIRERVDFEVVEGFCRQCRNIISAEVVGEVGKLSLPDEFFTPPNDQLVSAILQLKGGMKDLGMRLLATCIEDPFSDFRVEPENVAFLQRMQSRGINTQPWLNEAFRTVATDAKGKSYEVGFTREIRDVLLMGFHFDTCLSPGSFNFFSTIANAIDINKRVVYGKSVDGRIIGRCLFTLTDDGKILTFHRYAHNPSDHFPSAVDEFAIRLANAMNTTVASQGSTPRLEATRRYDDGIVPIGSTLDVSAPDSRVRTILRSSDLDAIISELENFFGSRAELRERLGIRLTRPKNVKTDTDETDGVRITAIARIHEVLGRHQLAQKLLATTN